MKTSPFNNPLFRHGTAATLITVLVIGVIILLNMVITMIFAKYPLNIDLTENRIFEISPDTAEFLSALDTDVDIYVLNTEAAFTASEPREYFVQANEVLRKYAQLSSHVRIAYIDLLRNPDFTSRYPEVSVKVNDILVTARDRSRSLKPEDLFNIRSSGYRSYIASSRAEQSITRALLGVVYNEQTLVSVITGHGEEDVTPFIELLNMNAYQAVQQNLISEAIAPDASIVILAAPLRDLTAEELRKLDAFLDTNTAGNKTLFYLASPSQPPLPNLAAFLAEWGIAVGEGVAFETDQSRLLSDSVYIALLDYAEAEFSKSSISRGILTVIPNARPLSLLFESSGYKTTSPLLRLSPSSGVRPAGAPADWQPTASDRAPNVPVMAISRSLRSGPSGALVRANVLVSGSTLALNQSILASPNIANSSYLLDLFSALTGREQTVHIEDKTMGLTELGATLDQVMIITIVFAGVLPLSMLICGVVVWRRRRHL